VGHGGFLDKHVQHICEVYKERRDIMLDALAEHMPDHVHWTQPKGGLFLWATLPEEIDTEVLFPKAVEQRVAFVPGGSFFPRGGGHNTMRLNFSNATNLKIVEGIARLGHVVKEALFEKSPV
jgi:2-aminoadipate transaminase